MRPDDSLLLWYDREAADLPWRRRRDPYAIWLAEIMLQQTQVETVIPYYERFLRHCPDLPALAAAQLDEVLKLWEGLGYYSRARNLHRTARILVAQHNACFPRTAAELQQLPGIGRYTAGAIASIAFDEAAPVLDGNVMRVFARLLDLDEDITRAATQRRLWALAQQWLPQTRPGAWNQALMELGRRICRPRQPDCPRCPLQAQCLARARSSQAQRPRRRPRAERPHYDVVAALLRNAQGELLLQRRPPDGLLGGLWTFPGGRVTAVDATLPDALHRLLRATLALEVQRGAALAPVQQGFTHFRHHTARLGVRTAVRAGCATAAGARLGPAGGAGALQLWPGRARAPRSPASQGLIENTHLRDDLRRPATRARCARGPVAAAGLVSYDRSCTFARAAKQELMFMSDIEKRGYSHPDMLVATDWVAQHLDDPQIRIVESNEDPLLYTSGHIPGAVQIDWTVDLNDQLRRDYLDQGGFETLMSRNGITPDTTVVFYGDKSNWWACYASGSSSSSATARRA